jgi:hypothetical protein
MKGLVGVGVQASMRRFVERVCVEIVVETDEVLVWFERVERDRLGLQCAVTLVRVT